MCIGHNRQGVTKINDQIQSSQLMISDKNYFLFFSQNHKLTSRSCKSNTSSIVFQKETFICIIFVMNLSLKITIALYHIIADFCHSHYIKRFLTTLEWKRWNLGFLTRKHGIFFYLIFTFAQLKYIAIHVWNAN